MGFLFDFNGLAVDIEFLVRAGEQVQDDTAVLGAVVHLLRQFGDRASEVAVAAEGIAALKTPLPGKRREVANMATVRGLRPEQGVVNRPFHNIPIPQIAFQSHEAVDPAEKIGRNAGFFDAPRTLLIVGEMLPFGG